MLGAGDSILYRVVNDYAVNHNLVTEFQRENVQLTGYNRLHTEEQSLKISIKTSEMLIELSESMIF